VAVAVSSLFAAALHDNAVADAPRMVAITFAVVVATVFVHGFTLAPLAGLLGLTAAPRPGVLIVGGSSFTADLAMTLKKAEIPVLVADGEWSRIREARLADIPTYFGEILSEDAHFEVNLQRFSAVIAATPNDAYNALVCTDLGPEVGRGNVFEIPTVRERAERKTLAFTLGGRPLTRDPELLLFDYQLGHARGWRFQVTRLSNELPYDAYLANRAEGTRVILWQKPSGRLFFRATTETASPAAGDRIIAYAPPREPGEAS